MTMQHTSTLWEISKAHKGKVSDKWSSYLDEYQRLFKEYQDLPISLLEIGIQNGGSMEIWAKYFEKATSLTGCDINEKCRNLTFDDPRIAVIVGDANSDAIQSEIVRRSARFDIIIDDGSHKSGDIVKTFCLYFPHLNQGGIYVVEDLHCSYWNEFEGGLHFPYSSISFFKNLCDVVNFEHWGIDMKSDGLLKGALEKYGSVIGVEDLRQIHSIEFANSMCFIRKASPEDNVLGKRVVAGSQSEVNTAPLAVESPTSIPYNQSQNPWSRFTHPPAEELLKIGLTRLGRDGQPISGDAILHSITGENEHLKSRISSMQSSLSWKISSPLRGLDHLLRLFWKKVGKPS